MPPCFPACPLLCPLRWASYFEGSFPPSEFRLLAHLRAVDDQLYKDIEGALEYCQDGLAAVAAAAQKGGAGGNSNGGALSDPSLLQASPVFWLCCCDL